jgi:hypothetical protein
MPFRHDAGIFRPNGVSRRTLNGIKTLNPGCFGVWGVTGKKAEYKSQTGSQLNARYVCVYFYCSYSRCGLAGQRDEQLTFLGLAATTKRK